MNKIYVGVDNGVTGTIGVILPNGDSKLVKTPIHKEQNYTKKKGNISRVIGSQVHDFFINIIEDYNIETSKFFCAIERPMVNPKRFTATISALRALEATLIIIEMLELPYMYIDSKEWQRELLPKGCKGDDLKPASKDIGCRLFPNHKDLIIKHGDADGILIAEYLKRKSF